ncbi:hypothetical protein F3Y22_tig00110429pilonHSYRG00502 [Hibiscus syriacus]|uniref:Uncharacterized protein n=1 Tax=Hibiscus syriacus TaxID=106335 RepID=A0A6A3AQS6_HIBSY|nr:hypothetical protein F3Y22_tig00110429pilonHSYRG00502 [Hibiscus syriacus]
MSASYLLESPGTNNYTTNLPTSDMNEGYEVREALRAQMLKNTCRFARMLNKYIWPCLRKLDFNAQFAEVVNACGQEEEMPTGLLSQRADGSTESCLTSQESPGGLTMEGFSSAEKENGGKGIMTVKMVLTKEELELLLVKLKNKNGNNGGYRLGGLLVEMEKVRSVKVECCWRPSLESIMEDEEDDVISS